MEQQLSSILMQASRIIQERGWANGSDADPWAGLTGQSVCAEGAIAAAMQLDGLGYNRVVANGCPAFTAVTKYLGFEDRLWAWNDAPGRTATEVINTLKAAAIVELCKEKTALLDMRDAVNEAMSSVTLEPVAA